jgi:hypothetical protein
MLTITITEVSNITAEVAEETVLACRTRANLEACVRRNLHDTASLNYQEAVLAQLDDNNWAPGTAITMPNGEYTDTWSITSDD